MTGSDQPPLSRIIAVVRTGLGLTQQELGSLSGDRWRRISDLERGDPEPSRAEAVRLLAAMGCREHSIDRTRDFLQGLKPIAPGRPGSFEEELEAILANMAAEQEASLRASFIPGHRRALALIEREVAGELWLLLADLPADQQRKAVELDRRYRRWGLAVLVAEASETAAADEAPRALELAELAVAIAERVEASEAWKSRLLGLALAFLANAQRVAGDLTEADRTFARARVLWEAGATGDPGLLDASRILDLEASLRRAQRLLDEALACVEGALRLARPEAAVRLMLKKATILKEMGEHEESIRTIEIVLPEIDPAADARLAWCARFNLVVNLCALDRAAEGEPRLAELGELALGFGNGLDRVRFRWLQGTVHAGCGRRGEAILALGEARDGFLARGIAYDAALASLELAVLLLEEGRTAEVREVAEKLGPVFESQGVHREALAALLVFRAAAEAEAATLAETRRILAFLVRARLDRKLRFEPGGPGEEGGL